MESLIEELVTDAPSDRCPNCKRARASTRKSRFCATCHKNWLDEQPKPLISPEVASKLASAKSSEDWQKLAAELSPVLAGILSGEVKASAAQASLLKDIINRAYGKPVATQSEKRVAAGVVILPTLDTGMKMKICPVCMHSETEDTLETE